MFCVSDVRPNESTLPEMKVNDHKRQASPSQLDREDTIFKKRHLITNQSHMEHESSCCSEKSSEAMQSGRPDENRVYDFKTSENVLTLVKFIPRNFLIL